MTKLAFYRRKAGLTQESLGKKLGVSKQLISAWENFAAVIDPKHVDKLKSALDLSEAEIIDIVADSVFTKENQKKSEPYKEVKAPSGEGLFVPIISSAAAATCNPGLMPLLDCVEQHSEEKTWFRQAKEGDFVIEVIGDSMNPWYPEGTLLLVRPYQQLRNGQRVVAVLDSGEIIFKVYAEKDDKVCLFSISDGGKDFIFTKPMVPLRYICRVVASQRSEDDLDAEMHNVNMVHGWQLKLKEI